MGVRCYVVGAASEWVPLKMQRGVQSRIVPGMKILVDDDFNPLSNMNEFTIKPAHRKRRAGKSWKNTQNAYTDDLYQYKTFLNALNIEEGDVTLDDLQDYGACFVEGVSLKSRRKFRTATAIRRFGTAIRYHKFRIFKGLPSSVSLSELSSQGGFRDGVLRSDPDSPYAVLPPDADPADKIHPILDGSWRSIFDLLGPESDKPCQGSRRTRLACETSLITGMRIDEICSLTVMQIKNLARHVDKSHPSKLIPLWITKTKGLKPGFVYLPSYLVNELLEYIAGERQAAIARAEVVRSSYEPTDSLFVNDSKSNYSTAANPLSADTLSRAFTSACIAAGFSHDVECFVLDEAGAPLVLPSGRSMLETMVAPDHTFHDLRHTFAMLTYIDAAQSGRKEPWKLVSTLLRHSSVLTTLQSYLKWLDMGEQALSDALMETLGKIDRLGARSP